MFSRQVAGPLDGTPCGSVHSLAGTAGPVLLKQEETVKACVLRWGPVQDDDGMMSSGGAVPRMNFEGNPYS